MRDGDGMQVERTGWSERAMVMREGGNEGGKGERDRERVSTVVEEEFKARERERERRWKYRRKGGVLCVIG